MNERIADFAGGFVAAALIVSAIALLLN